MNDDTVIKLSAVAVKCALFAFPAAFTILLYRIVSPSQPPVEETKEEAKTVASTERTPPLISVDKSCAIERENIVDDNGSHPAFSQDLEVESLLDKLWEQGGFVIKGCCLLAFSYLRLKDYFPWKYLTNRR